MSLNLHDIVRGAITANLDDQPFTLLRSVQSTVTNGVRVASYVRVEGLKGNFQSESDVSLNFSNNAAQNSIVRKLYLYATSDRATRPWAIYRPLARSGDYVINDKGEYWQVSSVIEDFSDAGWECLRVTFQQTPPNLSIIDTDPTETATEGD